MPHATAAEPTSVLATLNYFTPPPDGSKPWSNVNADFRAGPSASTRNWPEKPHPTTIENVRGHEAEFTLDGAGFAFLRGRPARHTRFQTDAEVEREYYPESVDLIKEATGASRVVLFDHTIRRRRPDEMDDAPDKRQPVPLVHVDQTPASSAARVARHLPPSLAAASPALPQPEIDALVQTYVSHAKRFQIINLWRPIRHAALDHPLALCDFRSTAPGDFVPTDLVYPDRRGETFSVKWSAAHRWVYLRGAGVDDVILIKCFDSDAVKDPSKGIAALTPHTAFDDPSTPADAPLRESIELRALVFYD